MINNSYTLKKVSNLISLNDPLNIFKGSLESFKCSQKKKNINVKYTQLKMAQHRSQGIKCVMS